MFSDPTSLVSKILVAACPALLALGCGGSPPPVEAPPAPVAKAADKPAPVDLSAVPEPRALAVQARIARPERMVKAIAEWAGTTAPSGEVIADAVVDLPVGDILDLSQPIDVAMTFEGTARPDIGWAVSAALVPGEGTLAKIRETFDIKVGQGGVARLEPAKDKDASDRRCAIFPAFSAGGATTRLVCSDSDKGLRELGPYLARTRPRVAIDKDLEVELRGAPAREFLSAGRQMLPSFASSMLGRRGKMALLAPVMKDVIGDAIDLGLDLDRLVVDADLGGGDLEANARLSFKGSTSMMGRFLTALPEKAGPPPEAFGRLPADADAAYFGRGWDAREMERPKVMFFQVARTLLEREGITGPDAEGLERAVNGYLELGTNGWVSGSGADRGQVSTAVKKLSDAKRAGKRDAILEAERVAFEKLDGWTVWGVELPMAQASSTVKDVVATFNRPLLQKGLKAQMRDVPAPTLKLTPVSAALKLPKDTLHVELTVTRTIDELSLEIGTTVAAPAARAQKGAGSKKETKAPPKPKLAKPVKLHAFVVPDGARTWIGWGVDEALVASRLRTAATGEGPTLATKQGIDAIRNGRWNSAGFVAGRAVARANAGVTGLFEPAGRLRVRGEDRLSLPDWGVTPLWFGVRSEAAGNERSTTFTFKVPRETLSELSAMGGR